MIDNAWRYIIEEAQIQSELIKKTYRLLSDYLIYLTLPTTDQSEAWNCQLAHSCVEVNPGESVMLTCVIANKQGDCRFVAVWQLCVNITVISPNLYLMPLGVQKH